MLGCIIGKSHALTFLLYHNKTPPSASQPNKPLGGAFKYSYLFNAPQKDLMTSYFN